MNAIVSFPRNNLVALHRSLDAHMCMTCLSTEVELRCAKDKVCCRVCYENLPEAAASYFWDWPLVARITPANFSRGPQRVRDPIVTARKVLACSVALFLLVVLTVR